MVTAKITCSVKSKVNDDQYSLVFGADYQDDRNKEWAKYTPALSINMTVNAEAAKHFEQGKAYTLRFAPE